MKTVDLGSFVKDVYTSGWFASNKETVDAIRANFRTLAECLHGATANDLASALPATIAGSMACDVAQTGEHLTSEQFIQRVASREHIDVRTATEHATIVMTALAFPLPASVMSRMRSELGHDLAAFLFGESPATGIAS